MDQIIIAAQAASQSRDQIIITLVTEHGLSISKASNLYAKVAKAEGWVTGAVSHKDEALADLHNDYDTRNWDAKAVKAAVVDLQDRYSIAESTARDYCKAFSEELGVAYPVEDPREAMFAWLIEHSEDGTKEEFKAYCKDLGRSDSNINEYWKGLELHRAIIAAKY